MPHLKNTALALLLLMVALVGPARAAAAPGPAAQEPGQAVGAPDSLRVFLITVGPGAAVWERFGHNALWIHDPVVGTDIAYHWGLFDMSEEGFLLEFLRGRMVYSMGSIDPSRLVSAYRSVGRPVTIQELALTVSQATALQEFAQWNVRPENRRYRYDYFRDNCSTRVRDALNDALDGALRLELVARSTPHTYRSEAVALTTGDLLLTNGMDLGLGPLADQPISHWELAFIPMRLRDDLRTMTVLRGDEERPLVVGERELAAADGTEPGEVGAAPPRSRVAGHLLAGLLLGALMGTLGALAVRGGAGGAAGLQTLRTPARWLLAILGSLWGLLTGVLGLVLLALWTLTDHEVAWRNENLLQTDPVALALVVLVPLAVLRGGSRWATRVAGLLVALSLLGLLLNPLPVTPQANLPIITLALPIHLGVLYALWRLERGPGKPA